jgi:hypothetical protein
MLSRRGFLGAILAAGAAPAIVKAANIMPVFVRREGGGLIVPETVVTGNTLITIDQITREALRILHKQTLFIKSVNRDYERGFK